MSTLTLETADSQSYNTFYGGATAGPYQPPGPTPSPIGQWSGTVPVEYGAPQPTPTPTPIPIEGGGAPTFTGTPYRKCSGCGPGTTAPGGTIPGSGATPTPLTQPGAAASAALADIMGGDMKSWLWLALAAVAGYVVGKNQK